MAEEVFEVTDNGVEFVDMDDIDVNDEAEEEGGSILGFLVAAGVGAGIGIGVSKLIPKIKAKKLEADKKKLEKLTARIEKAESEDIDESELEELTEEEAEEIRKLEEETKSNKKSKK